MIARLAGQVAAVDGQQAVVDCGGVGYAVAMSAPALARLRPGAQATVWVHTHLAQDAIRLFGFPEPADREAFLALLSVSGVGPRMALAVLSLFTPGALARAVGASDLDALRSVPGVGRRTAERILVELKDRLAPGGGEGGAPAAAGIGEAGVAADLESALVNVGFAPAVARRAAEQAAHEAAPTEATHELLRRALKLTAARGGGRAGA